jgi:hypothetical protein
VCGASGESSGDPSQRALVRPAREKVYQPRQHQAPGNGSVQAGTGRSDPQTIRKETRMNDQVQGTFRSVAMATDRGAGGRTRRASAPAAPIPRRNERSLDPAQRAGDSPFSLVLGQRRSSRSLESLIGCWSPFQNWSLFQKWVDALEALVIGQGMPHGRGTIQQLPPLVGPRRGCMKPVARNPFQT